MTPDDLALPIDAVFPRGYADAFCRSQRVAHSYAMDEVVKSGCPQIKLLPRTANRTEAVSIVSHYTPEHLATFCAVLFLCEVPIRSVDLYVGTLSHQRPRRYATFRAARSTLHDVMIARFVLQSRKQTFTNRFTHKVIQLLYDAEKEIRTRDPEDRDFILDGYSLSVHAPAQPKAPSETSARIVDVEVKTDENGCIHIRKTRSRAYPFCFALLLYAAKLKTGTLRYSQRGRMESIHFAAKEDDSDSNATNRLKTLLHLFPDCYEAPSFAPDPLKAFRRLLDVVAMLEDESVSLPEGIFGSQKTRDAVYRISGSSDFIWEEFFRSVHLPFRQILVRMSRAKSLAPSEGSVRRHIRVIRQLNIPFEHKYRKLNKYKDYVLFTIQLQYLVNGSPDVGTLAKKLTSLADITITAFTDLVYREMVDRHGPPLDGSGDSAPFCVYGLGKLGGSALGFASDLELLFVFGDSGAPNPQPAVTDFFSKLVRRFLVVFQTKSKGLFEPDMRLRPYGKKGNPATAVNEFLCYYSPQGASHSFERFALLKMRRICGSLALHRCIKDNLKRFFADPEYIQDDEMRDVRSARMHRSEGSFHIKRNEGALVDLEALIQLLQVQSFQTKTEIRTPALYKALLLLENHGMLERKDRTQISEAYYLFRRVVAALRILRGNSDNLRLSFSDNPDLAPLARRAGYHRIGTLTETEQLTTDLRLHSAFVRAFAVRAFGHCYSDCRTIWGIEDFLQQPAFEFGSLSKYFERNHRNVSSFMTAGFHSLFVLLDSHRLSRYLLVILGDAVLATPRPEVTCTRATILLRRRLEAGNDIEMWASRPDRMRLMIAMLGVGRSHFYRLLAHPELMLLFFLSSREIDRWYHRNVTTGIATILRKAKNDRSHLSRLLPLKQKFEFFLTLFTLDKTVPLKESRHLYRTYTSDLVARLIPIVADPNTWGKLQGETGFTICLSSSARGGVGLFGTLFLFVLHSHRSHRRKQADGPDAMAVSLHALLRSLREVLAQVTSEGCLLQILSPELEMNHSGVYSVKDPTLREHLGAALETAFPVWGKREILADYLRSHPLEEGKRPDDWREHCDPRHHSQREGDSPNGELSESVYGMEMILGESLEHRSAEELEQIYESIRHLSAIPIVGHLRI